MSGSTKLDQGTMINTSAQKQSVRVRHRRPLSSSIDSMSFRLMSASRFSSLSVVALGPVPDERVTELIPATFTAWLLTITPSTTMSGSALPRMDEVPRIWICPPPPGAPLFIWMLAPTTLPWSAFSTDTAGTRVKSSEVTTLTAVAAFCRSTGVACPVTTRPRARARPCRVPR